MLKSQILLAQAKNLGSAALVHVEGMDVADAGMVVLAVVPGEVGGEVVEHGLLVQRSKGLRVVGGLS